MNIAVVDYARIDPEAEFPWLSTKKEHRWTQFPLLDGPGMVVDCWRAHVLVTVAATIDAATIDKLPMLQYVIVAGDAPNLVDESAAKARGIRVSQVDASGSAAERCQRIVDTLDALIEGRLEHFIL